MAEDIVINIEVDDQDVINASQRVDQLTNSITDLEQETKLYKQENKELQKELDSLHNEIRNGNKLTQEQEKRYIDVDSQIKKNNKTIAENQVQIQKNKRERTASIKLMDSEVGTRERLRQKVSELNVQLNKINTSTEEGRREFDRLAAEMNQLNTELNEGSIASGNFKDNIGNYPQVMGPAVNAIELIQGGIKGMIKQALAFIATPLGAVLTAVTAAVGLFSAAVGRSASAQEQASRAAGTLRGAWNFLIDQIGTMVDDNLKILNRAIDDLIAGLTILGVLDKDSKFTQAIKDSRDLEKAENDLLFAEKELEKQQLLSQIAAERLRQIRDDDTKSIDERIKANNQLGETLDAQIERETALANEVLRIANLRARADGQTIENQLAIKDAEIKLIEIQERVESQRSEMLTNRNALLREKAVLETEDFNRRVEQAMIENEMTQAEIVQLEEDEIKKQEILDRAFEAEIEREQNRTDAKLNFQDSQAAQYEANQKRLVDITKKYADQRNAVTAKSIDYAGQALGQLITSTEQSTASFAKSLLLIALETVEKIILLSIAEVTAKEIASKGFAGIATGAVLAGIIKGVFAGIKSQVANTTFAEGGTIINGPSHSGGGVDVFGSNGQYFGNVEGGESMFVLKKTATEAMNLSNLNQSYGGRSFFSRPQRINQEGGQLAQQQTTISPSELRNLLQSVQIVVGVKDIIEGIDNRVQVLENAAT